MSLKSNYIVVSYSTTNVTNCLVCFTSLFSVLHEINKDSEDIMARIIFPQLPDQKLCWIVLFCKERRCCLTLFLCFPLVTRSWFMGYSVAGTCLEFCTNDAGTREFLVTGFRRKMLLFSLLQIFNVIWNFPCKRKKNTNNYKSYNWIIRCLLQMLTELICKIQCIEQHLSSQGSEHCRFDNFAHFCHFTFWNNYMKNSYIVSPFNNKDVPCLFCLPFPFSKDKLTQTNYSPIYTDISLPQHWTGQQGALGQILDIQVWYTV